MKITEPDAMLPKASHIAIGLKYILDFGTGEKRRASRGSIKVGPGVDSGADEGMRLILRIG
jgi:hypothetical protein